MPRLEDASSGQIDAVYRESHELWGGGLSIEEYRGLWEDLRQTEWVRRHARFVVWIDERDRVLSSAKVYRPRVRVLGRTCRVTVIGALFTPMAERGRGHGIALTEALLERARADSPAAMLFTDIGTSFYRRFGFSALAAEESWGKLPRSPGQDDGDWTLVPMDPSHEAAVRAAHDAFCGRRSLAILRDADHWEFLRVRSERFFERLAAPDVSLERQVALHRGEFAGYVIAVCGNGEWNVRELGSARGDPATLARILRLSLAAAARRGMGRFYGWLPPEMLDLMMDLRLRRRRRRRAVPMLRPLADFVDLARLDTPEAAYLPFQDQF